MFLKLGLMIAETTSRSDVNPTPSAESYWMVGGGIRFRAEATISLSGRVAERLKAHDWKSCGLIPTWVRIPPRPLEVAGICLAWDSVRAEGAERRRRPRIAAGDRRSIPPRPF